MPSLIKLPAETGGFLDFTNAVYLYNKEKI